MNFSKKGSNQSNELEMALRRAHTLQGQMASFINIEPVVVA